MASKEVEMVLARRGSMAGASQSAMRVARRIPTISSTSKKKLIAPVAGFVSAAVEISATWPLEYSKTQLQLNRTNPNFHIYQHLASSGTSIYKGITPMLIGAPMQGFLRFGCLDFFQNIFRDEKTGQIGIAAGLCAGIGAGILESILVVAPMETLKTTCINSGKSLTGSVKQIMASEGVSGVYKGVGATVAKSASNQALRFVIFNQYKNRLVQGREKKTLSSLESLAGGCIAGLLGALGNTPVDTVKSRLQGLEAGRYKSALHCAATMIKEEGPTSLYKGLLPRMGRVVPGQGIIFMCYGTLSDKLHKMV